MSVENIFSETDIDNDGIPDSTDLCMSEPETINGFEDTDGCPDVIPENESSKESESNNSLLQWTAVIASCITAAGGIAAAKYRKH
jgi:hypothetical protein